MTSQVLLDWLAKNKEWVFSGWGYGVITLTGGGVIVFVRWLLRRESPSEELARAELQRLRSAGVPFFSWRGGSTDHFSRTCKLENLGGTANSLTVHTAAPLNLSITPADKFLPNQQGFVRIAAKSGRIIYPFEFEVCYATDYGETKPERFRLEAPDSEPKRVR